MKIGFALFALPVTAALATVVWQPALFNMGKPRGLQTPLWYNRVLALVMIIFLLIVSVNQLFA